MVASTVWPPPWSCTRNMVLGSASTTSPSTSIFSSLVGKFPSVDRSLGREHAHGRAVREGDHRSKAALAPGVAYGDAVCPLGIGGIGGFAAATPGIVSTLGPSAVTATVCSK